MQYESNLVWIDLEMTGLDPVTDVILEIATVITDGQLNIIEQGPEFVIHQPEEKLAAMNTWCIEQHGKTGLTQEVRESTTTLKDAEEQTLSFITRLIFIAISSIAKWPATRFCISTVVLMWGIVMSA